MRVLNEKSAKFELDMKDSQILKLYSQNVRTPLTSIAKTCALSRNSVEYRLKQMHSLSLITGHKTVINTKKLGFTSYHVFLTIENTADSNAFKEKALKAPYVNAFITYRGKFVYEISIMARDETEFLHYYNELISGFKLFHEEIVILLSTIKSEVIPSKFLKLSSNFVNPYNQRKIIDSNIDKLDLKLMKILSEEANLSVIEIAHKLQTSRDTIQYRIKKLYNANYLIEYRAAINYYALGLSIHTVLVKLERNKETIEDFEKRIRGEDTIIWGARTFGKYDYIIYVLTSHIEQFHELFDNLKQGYTRSIITYELLFAHRSHKYSFLSENMCETIED